MTRHAINHSQLPALVAGYGDSIQMITSSHDGGIQCSIENLWSSDVADANSTEDEYGFGESCDDCGFRIFVSPEDLDKTHRNIRETCGDRNALHRWGHQGSPQGFKRCLACVIPDKSNVFPCQGYQGVCDTSKVLLNPCLGNNVAEETNPRLGELALLGIQFEIGGKEASEDLFQGGQVFRKCPREDNDIVQDKYIFSFQQSLAQRKRQPGESLIVFASELKHLVRRAHRTYNEAAIQGVTLQHFIQGIDSATRLRVIERNPSTIDQAVEIATLYEQAVAATTPRERSVNAVHRDDLQATVTTLTEQVSALTTLLQNHLSLTSGDSHRCRSHQETPTAATSVSYTVYLADKEARR
ncbi:hypothetical protein Bbelb_035070 [Branchiostoma belcheri]|nr:hypothetical protein Bbelb_035070 [Branchiostoma belcheri]